MNGLAVDPGSNGSVITVAEVWRGSRRRLAIARISTGVRIENDDVATLSAHARDRIGERLLRDLLQVGVDREHDVVALRRRGARLDRRLAAHAVHVADDSPRAGGAAQNRIERQLEPVDRLVVAVDMTEDPARAFRNGVRARDGREGMHAVQRDRGRGVDLQEPAGNREVLSVAVGGARDEGAIDRELPERGAKLFRVVDFARGDLEANGLAALREHAVGCVEDLTARCGDGFQRLLLLDREREPLLAVDELHLPRLHEDGDGEDREHGVRDADAS